MKLYIENTIIFLAFCRRHFASAIQNFTGGGMGVGIREIRTTIIWLTITILQLVPQELSYIELPDNPPITDQQSFLSAYFHHLLFLHVCWFKNFQIK